MAFDTTYNGGTDAFAIRLTGAGVHVWSTFLRGTALDTGRAIAVDTAGDAYVIGQTVSTNFPTMGGFDTIPGGPDGFVTKLTASGALAWSTYLGGSGSFDDVPNDVVTDGASNVFVVGTTRSTDFATSGGFDTTSGGSDDGFVTKLTTTGARLWSS